MPDQGAEEQWTVKVSSLFHTMYRVFSPEVRVTGALKEESCACAQDFEMDSNREHDKTQGCGVHHLAYLNMHKNSDTLIILPNSSVVEMYL